MITATKTGMEEETKSLTTNITLPPIGILADLSAEARKRLAMMGSFVNRPKDALLAIQGKAHHAMALILSGEVSINIHAHGDRVEIGVLKTGEVVGEMSLIDPRVASSTARVVSNSTNLWIIEQRAFEEFIAEDPTSGLILLKALGKVLCRRVRTDWEQMLRKTGEMREHFLDMDY